MLIYLLAALVFVSSLVTLLTAALIVWARVGGPAPYLRVTVCDRYGRPTAFVGATTEDELLAGVLATLELEGR
ncbi:MAG: hypothetical protein M3Q39_00930, partial [Actinomycetota bacterium]|nr:hypothetical protein [Actinomycetota bacterium]